MRQLFPFSYPQKLAKSISKSLVGFMPAVLTQQIFSAIGFMSGDNSSRAAFAVLTLAYNRLGESMMAYGYAEKQLQTLYLKGESSCSENSATAFVDGALVKIDPDEQEKIEFFFVEANSFDMREAKQQFMARQPQGLQYVIAKVVDYDVPKMFVACCVCYYMPVPVSNVWLAKIFNGAVAITVGVLSKQAYSLFTQCRERCKNINLGNTLTLLADQDMFVNGDCGINNI